MDRKTKKRYTDRVPFTGAEDEARTRYLHLGKVALYQMSYSRIFFFRPFFERLFIIRDRRPNVKDFFQKIKTNFERAKTKGRLLTGNRPLSFET